MHLVGFIIGTTGIVFFFSDHAIPNSVRETISAAKVQVFNETNSLYC